MGPPFNVDKLEADTKVVINIGLKDNRFLVALRFLERIFVYIKKEPDKENNIKAIFFKLYV